MDVLKEAWWQVSKDLNKAPGVEGQLLGDVLRMGHTNFLLETQRMLRDGTYQPQNVRRVYIPKANGKLRPLGIPTVRDRVVQAAVKIVLEPIFETDFQECSYGFRPGRNQHRALEKIRVTANQGYDWVLDADISNFFGEIDHEKMMELLKLRISDRRLLKLIHKWLKAGIMEDGEITTPEKGTPQGGVISPLLSNIYLDYLDRKWMRESCKVGVLIRYTVSCCGQKPW